MPHQGGPDDNVYYYENNRSLEEFWAEGTTAGGLALVLSNLVLLWVGYEVLVNRRRPDVAALLLVVMCVSILYHACRARFVCVLPYERHQMADHAAVNSLIIYVIVEGIVRPEFFDDGSSPTPSAYDLVLRARARANVRNAFFFLLVALTSFPLLYDVENRWIHAFSVAVPLLLLFLAALLTRTPLFANARYGWIGVALFAVAFIFYALLPESYYEVVHSLWHVFAMLSVYFVFRGIQG